MKSSSAPSRGNECVGPKDLKRVPQIRSPNFPAFSQLRDLCVSVVKSLSVIPCDDPIGFSGQRSFTLQTESIRGLGRCGNARRVWDLPSR